MTDAQTSTIVPACRALYLDHLRLAQAEGSSRGASAILLTTVNN